MRYLMLLVLQTALLLSWQDAEAQNIRVGAGAMAYSEALDIEVLGFQKQFSTNDDYRLTIAAEVDIIPQLTLGVALRSRGMRFFNRQIDPDGNDVGWINSQHTEKPYYQTGFASEIGYEIPLTLRYRLTASSLMPYLSAEYSFGSLETEGYALSYRVEGRERTKSEVQVALVGTAANSMTLGAGLEARVNSWFSFLADVGWRHTFTTYVDEDFMRVREANVLVGKIVLMFEVLGSATE